MIAPLIGDAQYAKSVVIKGTNNLESCVANANATATTIAGVMQGGMKSGTVSYSGTTTGLSGRAPWIHGSNTQNLDGSNWTE